MVGDSKGPTPFNGCHCLGNKAVRMSKLLAMWRSWSCVFQRRISLASALVSFAGAFHEISNFKFKFRLFPWNSTFSFYFVCRHLTNFYTFHRRKKLFLQGVLRFVFFKSPFSTLKGTFRAIAKKKKQTNKQTKQNSLVLIFDASI